MTASFWRRNTGVAGCLYIPPLSRSTTVGISCPSYLIEALLRAPYRYRGQAPCTASSPLKIRLLKQDEHPDYARIFRGLKADPRIYKVYIQLNLPQLTVFFQSGSLGVVNPADVEFFFGFTWSKSQRSQTCPYSLLLVVVEPACRLPDGTAVAPVAPV